MLVLKKIVFKQKNFDQQTFEQHLHTHEHINTC